MKSTHSAGDELNQINVDIELDIPTIYSNAQRKSIIELKIEQIIARQNAMNADVENIKRSTNVKYKNNWSHIKTMICIARINDRHWSLIALVVVCAFVSLFLYVGFV